MLTISVLAAMALAISLVFTQASGAHTQQAASAVRKTAAAHTAHTMLELRAASLRKGIAFYRQATWRWEKQAHHRLTPTSYSERRIASLKYLRWTAKLWIARAHSAKRYANSIFSDRGYLPPVQARLLGQKLAAAIYGWTGSEWDCLDRLWGTRNNQTLESGWNVYADNPISPAYGIPQADPGSKMATAGRNWLRSAYVQIKWGLRYIKTNGNFHTPCQALYYRLAHGSY